MKTEFTDWLVSEGHLESYSETTQLECEFSAYELNVLYDLFSEGNSF